MTAHPLSKTHRLPVSFTLNGVPTTQEVEPRSHLADVLREQMLLTGTHLGCEQGVCGACTLFVDGRPVRSCLTLAVSCAGSDIRTIEGLEDDPVMVRLRDAFSTHHGLQCGYCTPGMLATAYDIVRRKPGISTADIRKEISGNLCRCTGYEGIINAISSVVSDAAADISAEATLEPAPLERMPPKLPASLEANAVTVGPKGGSNFASGTAAPTRQVNNATETITIPTTADLDGARHIVRELQIDAPAEALWNVLTDIPAVVACIPGASMDSGVEDGVIAGRCAVNVGPMSTQFVGRAKISHSESDKSGYLIGRGRDKLSRSDLVGSLDFSIRPQGDISTLSLDMAYRLSGPLAQFGRPAIVDQVADQLLAQTAQGLAAAARGDSPAASGGTPLQGARFGLKVLWGLLRNLFQRK